MPYTGLWYSRGGWDGGSPFRQVVPPQARTMSAFSAIDVAAEPLVFHEPGVTLRVGDWDNLQVQTASGGTFLVVTGLRHGCPL